ncbi:MAG: ATPase domain-containing protein [archaeon]|nr:ATPase domain-containing protein [archaeon]
MKRVPTGIDGLDVLIQGGLPQASAVLLSGGPGTGKTIMSTQFLYKGAKDFGETGLFVTLETNLKNITWNMENFDWDIKSLQEKELFKIYKLNLSGRRKEDVEDQIFEELDVISEMVEKNNVKRLVIDSTTALGTWVKEQGSLRSMLFNFIDGLKKLDCTTLLTAETKGGKNDFSAFGVEEFISDGVISLYFSPPFRSIFIRKMRGTNHSMAPHPYNITERGILVKSKDEIMWESIK